MARTRGRLGANIAMLMREAGINCEELAAQLNFTLRDVYRLIEGRLLLPPRVLEKVAEALGRTKEELMYYEAKNVLPELQYMKEFKNPENLNLVLDLLDEYIELKESLQIYGCTMNVLYSLFSFGWMLKKVFEGCI